MTCEDVTTVLSQNIGYQILSDSVISQKNLYVIHKTGGKKKKRKNHKLYMEFVSLLLFIFQNFQIN
jgi:hypothetical protein